MKRDWDLIRDMLLKIEKLPPSIDITQIIVADSFISQDWYAEIENKEDDERKELIKQKMQLINSHMKLLIEAGLIVGHCDPQECHIPNKFRNKQLSNYICYGVCLTWQGYDFLDVIRKSSKWDKICKTLTDKGIELTIDAIMALAKQWTMQIISG